MEKAVRLTQVTKIYGEDQGRIEALRGIDLELDLGQLLMILGPSGSGKTTLISIIAGMLQATEGQCFVLGHQLSSLKNSQLSHFRGEDIGFVFQSFNVIPMLTAKENVAVPLLVRGMDYDKALAKAEELLIRFGLENRCDELPANLSGGMQQKAHCQKLHS